ncbi:MAG: hypothetical protein ACRCVT_10145 [Leadbetterella sp.]
MITYEFQLITDSASALHKAGELRIYDTLYVEVNPSSIFDEDAEAERLARNWFEKQVREFNNPRRSYLLHCSRISHMNIAGDFKKKEDARWDRIFNSTAKKGKMVECNGEIFSESTL